MRHSSDVQDVNLIDRILYGATMPFTSSFHAQAHMTMHKYAFKDDTPSEVLVQTAWQEYLNMSQQTVHHLSQF